MRLVNITQISRQIADNYSRFGYASLGACLGIPREPRWLCKGADARRAEPAVVDSTAKPRNAADAPCRANPEGSGGFGLSRRCRLLIGSHPTSSAPPRLRPNRP